MTISMSRREVIRTAAALDAADAAARDSAQRIAADLVRG
jgi:hypothetical protein